MRPRATRQRRPLLCWLLPAWLAVGAALAGEPPLELGLGQEGAVEVDAGQAVTSAFSVTHGGPHPERIRFEVELPTGWWLTVPLADVVLEPGQPVTRLLSVYVPSSAAAGTYAVRLRVHREGGGEPAAGEARVTVLARRGLSLAVVDAPRVAAAGEPFVARFLLTNSGNIPDTVHVRAHLDSPFTATLPDGQMVLSAREQREVAVTVRGTSGAAHSSTVMVNLLALAVGDSERRGRATAVVQVVPVGVPREVAQAVPAEVRLAAIGHGGEVASQIEIASDNGTHASPISFNVRLPQMGGSSLFRYQDYYHARYEAERFSAILGDHRFEATPLLSTGIQSFGGEARAEVGEWSVMGFYARNRHFLAHESHQALHLSYDRGPNWIGAGLLRARGRTDGDVLSLRSVLAPDAASRIDLEISGGTDRAARLHATGRYESLAYQVEWISAGRDFPGLHRGQEQRHARLTLYPLPSLSLEARYSDFRQALARQQSARGVRSYRLAMRADGKPVLRGSSLVLAYSDQSRSFAGLLGHDVSEAAIEAGLSYGRRGFFGSASAELGTFSSSQEIVVPSSLRRLTLQGSFGGGRLSGSAWVQVQAGPSISNPLATGSVTTALTGQVALSATVSADANVSFAHYRSSRDVLLARSRVRLRWRLPIGGTLDLGVRHQRFDGFRQHEVLEYTLGYSLPFGIPHAAKTAASRVRGRLVDENGRPIQDVLVRMGDDSALTDAEGRFVLPALESELHYLYVDRLTLGLDLIPLVEMPLAIRPEDAVDDIVIPVARSAAVRGRIERRALAEAPLPPLIVEITDGGSRLRTRTNGAGRFSFQDLRPGRWEVRIVGGEVGDQLLLEEDQIQVDLAPGVAADVAFAVRERDRMVRIIQHGVIRAGQQP